ncbi:MAG: hypothetical protein CYPHOPRED_001485 [Cyphobasidiales sp. Tagirdzhanova-0007]|nr:MAG: hypothetical protein CYPHOPRED_001485 [Cyphobasidiales sp. Tagirdzhanova-0007]
MHFPGHNRSPSPEGDEVSNDKQKLHPTQQGSADALRKAIAHSSQPGTATSGAGVLGHADKAIKSEAGKWLRDFIPGIEKYAAEEEMVKESIKQGKTFDQGEGAYEHITGFVQTYQLEDSLDQLAQPDLKSYKTFNEFFSRALKPNARPADSPEDPSVVVSSADCRLTVWESVTSATEIWIKGKQFSIPHLLHDDTIAAHPSFANGCALAIFRLAPQDYHRWHSPLMGKIGPVKNISGNLYTVNPMAVRNPDVDVYTANKRAIQLINVPSLRQGEAPIPIPIVSIGAMLVGSIAFTKNPGDLVQKGEELGYFSYGGSTVAIVFPKDFIKFDEDLVNSSKNMLETVVKVGDRIGTRLQ